MISEPIYPEYPCITEARIANFQPTWLMIKQHKITGLKYFCKTTKADPYPYPGSGKHWVRHIKKHGTKHIETSWCQLFTEIYELVHYALTFSKENDIVASKEWANLRPENGLSGAASGPDHHWFGKPSAYTKSGPEHHAFGKLRPEDVKEKIGIGQKQRDESTFLRGEQHPGFGKPRPDSVKQILSIKNNGRVLGPQTPEHSAKISKGLKAYKRTPEHNANMGAAKRGKTFKKKVPTKQGTCLHCGKTMDLANLAKYHNDRCSSQISKDKNLK